VSRTVRGQGSNSANIRLFNERVILSALRRLGEASKADLARFANLTDNTAGVIVRQLETQRLVRSGGKRLGARGQPATLLRLDAGGAYSIGIEIGRRATDILLVDFCGHVLERHSHERPFLPPREMLSLVLDDVRRLRRAIPVGKADRLAGLGIALPYDMDCWRREPDLPSGPYRGWSGFDIAGELAAATGLPVFAENDGTAAAAAELFQGHGRRLDDFLYVFIGAAIGGGVVIEGEYLRGVTGNGGGIGLVPVSPSRLPSAPPLPPGRSCDILLARASINSLIRHLRPAGPAAGTRAGLEAAIRARPDLAGEWVEDAADALAAPLMSAALVLDMPTVVVDGTLPRFLVDEMIATTARNLEALAPEARPPPELRPGSLGREAPAIGAAILPLHFNFGPSRGLLVNAQAQRQEAGAA
jgi:predicted NBD/HSP70 family sugar kinase